MWLYCTAYAILGLMDLVLSQIAFSEGILEGNPVLNFLQNHNLFFPAKIFLTVSIIILIATLYRQKQKTIRIISWATIIVMTAVNSYHLWALNQIIK